MVHIVVRLAEEDWPLIWEDQDDVLDCIEAHSHGDEEEGAVSVLDSGQRLINLGEKHNTEECRQNGHDQLHITGLWKSDNVLEVPLSQERELVRPCTGGLEHPGLLRGGDWPHSLGPSTRVIAKCRALVLLAEELNPLGIKLHDSILITPAWVLLLDFLFNGLDTHDTHEIV